MELWSRNGNGKITHNRLQNTKKAEVLNSANLKSTIDNHSLLPESITNKYDCIPLYAIDKTRIKVYKKTKKTVKNDLNSKAKMFHFAKIYIYSVNGNKMSDIGKTNAEKKSIKSMRWWIAMPEGSKMIKLDNGKTW